LDSDYQLIIIGTKGVGTDYLLKYMDERSIPSKCILFTGGISDNEKINILKYSKFYFQFSKYEVFGIAALEALASRNIVIHSGIGGLKDTLLDYGYNVGWPTNKSKVIEIFKEYQSLEGYDLSRYNNILNHLNRRFSHSIRLDKLSSMILNK
jgi:glycosyltransferase involved in cell wall biosynthesis